MKKSLILALALVFVFAVAGTAFAAANPFVDVPANHWAYGAVADLSKAGIVDGYNDGTFRGDRTMTRYEMAQIVAKALAREDKANAQQKATIDKLAVEFASELNSLGVRVTKLEQNQPKLLFNGDFRLRYTDGEYDDSTKTPTNIAYQYRLRLDGKAQINDKTSFGLRFVTNEPDKADFANDTWQKFNGNGQSSRGTNNSTIDRVFLTTKIGALDITGGRQSIKIDPMDILMDSGAFSFGGVKLAAKAGNVNVVGTYGSFVNGVKYTKADPADSTKLIDVDALNAFKYVDISSLGVASNTGKFTWGLGWTSLKNNDTNGLPSDTLATYYMGNVGYLFNPKLSVNAEYVKNNDTDNFKQSSGTDGNDDLWAVSVVLGDQALKAKGNQNLTLAYTDIGANTIVNRFSSLTATPGNNAFVNYKEYWIDYNYAFGKNFNGTLEYANVNPDGDNNNIDQWRVITQVKF